MVESSQLIKGIVAYAPPPWMLTPSPALNFSTAFLIGYHSEYFIFSAMYSAYFWFI